MGEKRLHGWHQSAQKSTRTMSLSVTVLSKFSVVSAVVAMCGPFRRQVSVRHRVQRPARSRYSLRLHTKGRFKACVEPVQNQFAFGLIRADAPDGVRPGNLLEVEPGVQRE